MKILIACELSGIVRNAFRAKGHDAVSCDVEPTEAPGPHYRGDVRDILREPWDMMIAFPPCTHLATSGARWFPQKVADGRQGAALDFVRLLASVPFPYALENPVGILSTRWRKPDQIIQPWQFGDSASKQTCLWLRDLPPLIPTDVVDPGEFHVTSGGRKLPSWYNLPPGPGRARVRSQTFPGIALAMADQWG